MACVNINWARESLAGMGGSRVTVVVDGGVVIAFSVEKEDKTDDDEDNGNGNGVGSYCNASEKVQLCGCTLARYQSYYFPTLSL